MPVVTLDNFCNGSCTHVSAMAEHRLHMLPMGSHECMTVECNIYANVQERLRKVVCMGNDPAIECNVQQVLFIHMTRASSDVKLIKKANLRQKSQISKNAVNPFIAHIECNTHSIYL